MTALVGKKILVVEDERLVALDLQRSLEHMGYVVPATPATTAEALAAAADHLPDLVLMDVRLANNDDGIATADALRSIRDVPVVFLTAYADTETIMRARRVGPFGYLVKPIRPDELRSTVEIALYRHTMETQLRQREQWFATTLRAIGDAVIAVDPAGLVTFANPTAEALTGVAMAAAVGKPLHEVFVVLDERTRIPLARPLGQALHPHWPSSTDAPQQVALRCGAIERPIEQSVAPIRDDRGEVLGAVTVFRDVSERRLTQQRLVLADRMASLGTLAAGVAHEINNPLTQILSNAAQMTEILSQMRSPAPIADGQATDTLATYAQASELVQEIEMAADRVSRIVADLKRFARPTSEAAVPTDVRKALAWALRIVSTEVRSRAQLMTIFEAVPLVLGSEMLLGQVFVNLLTNAIYAITEGAPDKNELRIRTYTSPQGQATITITDSGCGIPDDVISRIFDPFFTTKPAGRGAGLGLAIADGIVRSIGGTITVESTLGVGSALTIALPAAPARSLQTPVGLEAITADAPRSKILVVDNDPAVQRTIKLALSGHHQLTFASNWAAAIGHLFSDDSFDVVLCDGQVVDVGGPRVLTELLVAKPELAARVVIMTNSGPHAAVHRQPSPAIRTHLAKPFSPRELYELVHVLLASLADESPA